MEQGEYKTRGKWWWVVARLSKQQQPAEWNEAFIKLPIKGTNMKKNINNILYSANWIHCTVWFVGYTCTCTYTYFTLFVWVCSKHVHEGFYLLNNERSRSKYDGLSRAARPLWIFFSNGIDHLRERKVPSNGTPSIQTQFEMTYRGEHMCRQRRSEV